MTGVQTCALPIFPGRPESSLEFRGGRTRSRRGGYGRDDASAPGGVRDIADLLRIANQLGSKITKPRPYISSSFCDISYERVTRFSLKHPDYVQLWMGLGSLNPTPELSGYGMAVRW